MQYKGLQCMKITSNFHHTYVVQSPYPSNYVLETVQQASQGERMMMTVAEIVKQLIQAHEEGRDVNLNK